MLYWPLIDWLSLFLISEPFRKSVREYTCRGAKSSMPPNRTTRRATAVSSPHSYVNSSSFEILEKIVSNFWFPFDRVCSEEPCGGAAQRLTGSPELNGDGVRRGGEQVPLSGGDELQRSDGLLLSADQLSGQCCEVHRWRQEWLEKGLLVTFVESSPLNKCQDSNLWCQVNKRVHNKWCKIDERLMVVLSCLVLSCLVRYLESCNVPITMKRKCQSSSNTTSSNSDDGKQKGPSRMQVSEGMFHYFHSTPFTH